jgi:hypothetical protein
LADTPELAGDLLGRVHSILLRESVRAWVPGDLLEWCELHAATLDQVDKARVASALAAVRALDGPRVLTWCVVYGDPSPEVLVDESSGHLAVIDWGTPSWGPLLHDIACWTAFYGADAGDDFAAFLAAYRRSVPLSDDEVRALPSSVNSRGRFVCNEAGSATIAVSTPARSDPVRSSRSRRKRSASGALSDSHSSLRPCREHPRGAFEPIERVERRVRSAAVAREERWWSLSDRAEAKDVELGEIPVWIVEIRVFPVEYGGALPHASAAGEHELPKVRVVLEERDGRDLVKRSRRLDDCAEQADLRPIRSRPRQFVEVLERFFVVVETARCLGIADPDLLAACGGSPHCVQRMHCRMRAPCRPPRTFSLVAGKPSDERPQWLAVHELHQRGLRAHLLAAREYPRDRGADGGEGLMDPPLAAQSHQRSVRLRLLPVTTKNTPIAARVGDGQVGVETRRRNGLDRRDAPNPCSRVERRGKIVARHLNPESVRHARDASACTPNQGTRPGRS